MSLSQRQLLSPPPRQIAELAAFLLQNAEGYGYAIFDVNRGKWLCTYLSPRASIYLGGDDSAESPPYLPALIEALSDDVSSGMTQPHNRRFGSQLIELRGHFAGATAPLPKIGVNADESRTYYVILRAVGAKENRLREERDRLNRALDATGQAVWDWDLETGEAYVSPRWAEMLGKPEGGNADVDAYYSPENWLDVIHPDDREPVAQAYAEFLVGDSKEYDIEFRIRYEGGGYRWIRSRASALRHADNTAWRVTGAHSDITERKELERTQETLLSQQSRIAETLQRVLLPLRGGTNYPLIEVALHYEPASDEAMVGGDFCDAFPVSDREIALVVGDMMGKGLNAAVGTAELKFSLRTLLWQYRDPAVALRLLNRFLWDTYKGERKQNPPLVPLSIVIANFKTRYLSVAVAGAEPPMVLRNDRETGATVTEEAKCGGLMIGTLPDEDYERQVIAMGMNDCLLMTTDGLTEVRDAWTGSFLGAKGVARLTHHALASRRPLDDVKGAVVRSVTNYGGGKEAMRDDVSMILARWRNAPSER